MSLGERPVFSVCHEHRMGTEFTKGQCQGDERLGIPAGTRHHECDPRPSGGAEPRTDKVVHTNSRHELEGRPR